MSDMKRRMDHLDDISPEQAIGMLVDDMRRRGVVFETPSDPMKDLAFIDLVGRTYFISPARYPAEAPPDIPA